MTLYIESRLKSGLIQEVATCGPTDADCGYGEQQKANARLIAAAPDLLECLKDICENGYGMISVERGRAAIAKATGETA
jgi:hypothetical protein